MFKKKSTKIGITAMLVLTMMFSLVGGFSVYQNNQTNSMPDKLYVEGDVVQIPDAPVPMGMVKVKTTKKTKTKTKTIKLEAKSEFTYTVKMDPVVTVTYSSSEKKGKTTDVKTEVTVTVTEKYKKKSNKKTVTTKTVTKTTKTTYATPPKTLVVPEAEAKEQPAEEIVSAPALSDIRRMAPLANENVLSAFEELGFKVVVNPSVSYEGRLQGESRTLTLKVANDNVYHELGHFIAFVAGNVDTSSTFKDIYSREKSKCTGRNPSYVLKDSEEYFAESYRNYILDGDNLLKERPETYAFIESSVAKINANQVSKIKMVFSSIWK